MSKKTHLKKMKLGSKIKQDRRMPLLTVLRTHRKLQSNRFSRNWRKQKIKLDD